MIIPKILDWDKPYNEIVIPKGMRLIKLWELFKLLDSKYSDKFLGNYKGKWNYFWCEQTKYAKLNNRSSGLCLVRGLDLYSGDVSLAYSDDCGRVVFVKKGWKI